MVGIANAEETIAERVKTCVDELHNFSRIMKKKFLEMGCFKQ